MTMKEFRKELNAKRNFAKSFIPGLVEWYDEIEVVIETLWKQGFVTEYTNDMLKCANGFQINTCNYETFHVSQTFDLHTIKADKKATKEFAEFLIG